MKLSPGVAINTAMSMSRNPPGPPRRRAVREIIPSDRDASVRFAVHDDPHPYARWNYHPEYELHLIQASTGRYVIGDTAGAYAPGQLTLLGPNLPHQWIAVRDTAQTIPEAHAVLHFSDEWVRACQSAIPELSVLDSLLRRSTQGLEFHGLTAERAGKAFHRVHAATDAMERVVAVLALLHLLATASIEDSRLIVPGELSHSESSARVAQAVEYIFENLRTDVRLSEAARRAAMSDSAFSRYFKAASGRTFTMMVRELRLAEACRLLESSTESIAQIATEVGYTNLSNFNRQFRRELGVTPSQHRRGAASAASAAMSGA